MKKFTIISLLLALCIGLPANPFGKKAEIKFTKEEHNFGRIERKSKAETEFTFTNTGTAPLILSEVKSSCGCTVPEWPKEPVAPGASASIIVKYNTAKVGSFNKSITVYSNAKENNVVVLQIFGEVVQK